MVFVILGEILSQIVYTFWIFYFRQLYFVLYLKSELLNCGFKKKLFCSLVWVFGYLNFFPRFLTSLSIYPLKLPPFHFSRWRSWCLCLACFVPLSLKPSLPWRTTTHAPGWSGSWDASLPFSWETSTRFSWPSWTMSTLRWSPHTPLCLLSTVSLL